jgi:hypothetical protein
MIHREPLRGCLFLRGDLINQGRATHIYIATLEVLVRIDIGSFGSDQTLLVVGKRALQGLRCSESMISY